MTENDKESNYTTSSFDNILVTAIVPVRNEEKCIENFIKSILLQDFPKNRLELIFINGKSNDKTLNIINKYREKFESFKIYENPNKTVQYALNIGIKHANGIYIVRLDAHSEYDKSYISKCIEILQKTNAQNVGGPMIAKGNTPIQRVIAAAYHSKFALGGGKFHCEDYEGYADTVYLGAFRKETLESLGMYDENFIRNEDDDLNFRMIESGGKIYISPQIKSIYYPRSSYKDLFKQYYEYGLWKVAVIKKHRRPARISHLIPASFVLFIILFTFLSLFSRFARYVFLCVMLLYFLLDVYFSCSNSQIKKVTDKLRLMLVHFILHISYGIGFLAGCFKFFKSKF